ncbi:hypothetical protein BKA81DRAFT_98506 [Phyllosticta paracitricarpa]
MTVYFVSLLLLLNCCSSSRFLFLIPRARKRYTRLLFLFPLFNSLPLVFYFSMEQDDRSPSIKRFARNGVRGDEVE